MSAKDLPAPHITFVFTALMLRAGLMSWAQFEAELTATFGPTFGPAIAKRARVNSGASEPPHLRRADRDQPSPRRL